MQQGRVFSGVTCCGVPLGNSPRSAWLCPPPSALATGFVFRKHFGSGGDGGGERSVRLLGGHTAPAAAPALPGRRVPCSSAPAFFRGKLSRWDLGA